MPILQQVQNYGIDGGEKSKIVSGYGESTVVTWIARQANQVWLRCFFIILKRQPIC